MRNWFVIPLAVIVGGIAGSWGPREDLARYKEGVQSENAIRKASKLAGFDAFARLANIPDVAHHARSSSADDVARHEPMSASEAPTNGTARVGGAKRKPSAAASRKDLGLRLEEAAELWSTRVELAKMQWKGKLGITDEQSSQAFDAVVGEMNESIRQTMQAMAEEIEKAGRLNAELSLRLMGDVSRTLAETYDALGEMLPAERHGEVSDVPVFEFVDPMVADPLVSVQDKLETADK